MGRHLMRQRKEEPTPISGRTNAGKELEHYSCSSNVSCLSLAASFVPFFNHPRLRVRTDKVGLVEQNNFKFPIQSASRLHKQNEEICLYSWRALRRRPSSAFVHPASGSLDSPSELRQAWKMTDSLTMRMIDV